MAIYNGRILMRKGNEADFDPSKLMSGEWAVSLDAGIVRICLEAGKVIRMATYEAFEEDMKQIEAILLECQTIEEAVRRINTEVSEKLNACAEYVQQAKNYSEQAKTSEANTKSYMQSAKTSEENAKVSETNAKASENSAKEYENSAKLTEERAREVFESIPEDYSTISNDLYELAIKETASGEEIHVNDSSNLKLREFALYGKARQNTTSGKNLLENTYSTKTINGITFTVNDDGSITANGTSTGEIQETVGTIVLKSGEYKLSGCPKNATGYRLDVRYGEIIVVDTGDGGTISITEDTTVKCYIRIWTGNTLNNVVFYPMIRLASITDDTWEPYTNGASPNPQYPQPIEVSGESYNLLENTATSKETNGITFTVNEDKSISVNGTSTEEIIFMINNSQELENGDYILSGVINGTDSTYKLQYNVNDYFHNVFNAEIPISKSTEHNIIARIVIRKGVTVDTTFYPMIRKASVKNDRYIPYGVDRVEVKSVGKNLLKIENTTKTKSGITWTAYDDGHIVANGTSSDYCTFDIPISLKDGITYVASGVSGGSLDTYQVFLQKADGYSTSAGYFTNGEKTFTKDSDKYNVAIFRCRIASGYTANNLTFYPMIRRATDTDGTFESYKETLAKIPTKNGLAGIKVSSGGNYTDSNGQQWICDEVVKFADGSGKKIQRVKKKLLSEATSISIENVNDRQRFALNNVLNGMVNSFKALISNVFIADTSPITSGTVKDNTICGYKGGATAFVICYSCSDGDALRQMLIDTNAYVIYALAEPIVTPLTAEEIAEIEKLQTFYPVTNISNDFDCGMKVKYNADSKNYIDKQLAEMEKAREQAMMSMFLLLPEETQATMIENDVNNLLTESEI